MSKKIEKELTDILGDHYLRLSSKKQMMIVKLYREQKKGEIIYLFWFLGFHYCYIRQWLLFSLFFITFGGGGIWWLIDLFRLPTILDAYNVKLAKELLNRIKLY